MNRKAEGLALLVKIAQEEELHIESWPTVACALAGLEAMCANLADYDALCRQIKAARREEPLPLVQWRLQSAKGDSHYDAAIASQKTRFSEKPIMSGWTWHDQFGDCRYHVDDHDLVIYAANYHDLWLNNYAAPHFLRAVTGDFAVQVVCTTASDDQPALGGLLFWHDRQNYLRVTWNTLAPDGIELLVSLCTL